VTLLYVVNIDFNSAAISAQLKLVAMTVKTMYPGARVDVGEGAAMDWRERSVPLNEA
jgi:hypothetical protein